MYILSRRTYKKELLLDLLPTPDATGLQHDGSCRLQKVAGGDLAVRVLVYCCGVSVFIKEYVKLVTFSTFSKPGDWEVI